MNFFMLFSRQGKVRLQKWYSAIPLRERKKISRDLIPVILSRKPKMCSILDWRDFKIVYRRYFCIYLSYLFIRYASLYFCCAIEPEDNELITFEIIHRYVELLDRYFGSVCELDIIFHFEKAYFVLDELILAGELQETSKEDIIRDVDAQDILQELQYSAEAAEMEVIHLPDMARVDGPGLCSVKECRQDDSLVNLQFGVQVNTVAIPDGGLQPAEGLTGFGDPLGNLFIHSRVACQRAS
ncbi:unnamed protein product [Schistocephalus solidus]|uniref:Clat_adaptor_s domain-containing protein n=1 Tax=Schistocephalus solidus TaxID=70667 RepID=A0A183SJ97_SCHSO|nr:unnamed protein product [Schistocephalus solidus]